MFRLIKFSHNSYHLFCNKLNIITNHLTLPVCAPSKPVSAYICTFHGSEKTQKVFSFHALDKRYKLNVFQTRYVNDLISTLPQDGQNRAVSSVRCIQDLISSRKGMEMGPAMYQGIAQALIATPIVDATEIKKMTLSLIQTIDYGFYEYQEIKVALQNCFKQLKLNTIENEEDLEEITVAFLKKFHALPCSMLRTELLDSTGLSITTNENTIVNVIGSLCENIHMHHVPLNTIGFLFNLNNIKSSDLLEKVVLKLINNIKCYGKCLASFNLTLLSQSTRKQLALASIGVQDGLTVWRALRLQSIQDEELHKELILAITKEMPPQATKYLGQLYLKRDLPFLKELAFVWMKKCVDRRGFFEAIQLCDIKDVDWRKEVALALVNTCWHTNRIELEMILEHIEDVVFCKKIAVILTEKGGVLPCTHFQNIHLFAHLVQDKMLQETLIFNLLKQRHMSNDSMESLGCLLEHCDNDSLRKEVGLQVFIGVSRNGYGQASPMQAMECVAKCSMIKDSQIRSELYHNILTYFRDMHYQNGRYLFDFIDYWKLTENKQGIKDLVQITREVSGVTDELVSGIFDKKIEMVFLDDWAEKDKQVITQRIFAYGNHSIVKFIIKCFLLYDSPAYKAALVSLHRSSLQSKAKELVGPKILPSILPAFWIVKAKTNVPEALVRFLQKYKREIKNVMKPLLPQYLSTTKAFNELKGIPFLQKLYLLSKACDPDVNDDVDKIVVNLRVLYYFCCMRPEKIRDLILGDRPYTELITLFANNISEKYFIPSLTQEELLQRYQITFGAMRISFGFETYAAAVNDVPELHPILQRFMQSVLLNTFEEERYRTDNNPHLKQIEDYGYGVLSSWKSLTYEKVVKETTRNIQETVSYKSFFKEQLRAQRWHPDGQDLLPRLTHFLQTGEEKNAEKESDITFLEMICIELIKKPNMSEEECQKHLSQAIVIAQKYKLGLSDDLKGNLQSHIVLQKMEQEKVVVCKKWQDFFLSGTEVFGSCQRIDGSSDLNKCLLAYCLDGKNGLIAVVDSQEKILARSIFRILWNPVEQKPALFLSRYYANDNKKREEAILQAAITCAKEMGLSLYIASIQQDAHHLVSLGSSCPFEYADDGGGVTQGAYSVWGKQIICVSDYSSSESAAI